MATKTPTTATGQQGRLQVQSRRMLPVVLCDKKIICRPLWVISHTVVVAVQVVVPKVQWQRHEMGSALLEGKK